MSRRSAADPRRPVSAALTPPAQGGKPEEGISLEPRTPSRLIRGAESAIDALLAQCRWLAVHGRQRADSGDQKTS